MADSIVAKIGIEVEGADVAAAELQKVGDAATGSFAQTQKAAEMGGAAVGKSLDNTGKALDDTTKKSGLTRREMSALGKVMASFGGGEIAHAAVSISRVGSALGALGVAAIGIGLAATALVKFGSEALKAGEAIEKIARISDTPFAKVASLQAGFAKLGVSAEKFGETMGGVLEKIATAAETSDAAMAESSKKIADAQLALLRARVEAEPGLKGALAQDIREAEEKQKLNNVLEAQHRLRSAEANDLETNAKKWRLLGEGIHVTFDALTTTATKIEALKIALKGLPLDVVMRRLARMADVMDDLQKRDFSRVLKGLEFNDEEVKQILKGDAAMKKLQATPALKPENLEAINAFKNTWQETVDQVGGLVDALTIKLGQEVIRWKQIFSQKLGFGAAIAESFGPLMGFIRLMVTTPVANAWQWIASTAASAWESVIAFARQADDQIVAFVTTARANAWQWVADTAASVWQSIAAFAQQAYDRVVAFVTTAPGNAWQWIVDNFNAAVDGITGAIASAYAAVVSFVTTPVANAWQWVKDTFNAALQWIADKWAEFKKSLGLGGTPAADTGGGGGHARGGLLGGRGTGTSDSNLAWVSRGEHIMPAGVVRQPGVLAFLEALRNSGGDLRHLLNGMGRFAAGGLVGPVSVPAFAGGGMSRDLGTLTLGLPGGASVTVRATSGVVEELRRAAALGQVRSGGRKPSRYS